MATDRILITLAEVLGDVILPNQHVNKAAFEAAFADFASQVQRVADKSLSGPLIERPSLNSDTLAYYATDTKEIYFNLRTEWRAASAAVDALARQDIANHLAASNPHKITPELIGAARIGESLPTGGQVGEALIKTATGYAWQRQLIGPYRGARLRLAADLSVPTGSDTHVPLSVANLDTDGMIAQDAQGRWGLLIKSGILKVQFVLSAQWGSIATATLGQNRRIRLQRGGSDFNGRADSLEIANASNPTTVASVVLDVSAGEFYHVTAFQNRGVTDTLLASATTLDCEIVETIDGKTGGGGGAVASRWWYATSEPAGAIGNDGDFALGTANSILGNVYYKQAGGWILLANIRGQQGATGAQGAKGDKGDPGTISGLPPGGSAGDLLARVLPDSAQWVPPTSGGGGSGVPVGGNAGQVLKKNSSTDGDVSWQNDLTGPVATAPNILRGLAVIEDYYNNETRDGQPDYTNAFRAAMADHVNRTRVGFGPRGFIRMAQVELPQYIPDGGEFVLTAATSERAVIRGNTGVDSGTSAALLRKYRYRHWRNNTWNQGVTRGQDTFSGLSIPSAVDPKQSRNKWWLTLYPVNGSNAYNTDRAGHMSEIVHVSGSTVTTRDPVNYAWASTNGCEAWVVRPMTGLRMMNIRFEGRSYNNPFHMVSIGGVHGARLTDCEFVSDIDRTKTQTYDCLECLEWYDSIVEHCDFRDAFHQNNGYGAGFTGLHTTFRDCKFVNCKHGFSGRAAHFTSAYNLIINCVFDSTLITACDWHEPCAKNRVTQCLFKSLGYDRNGYILDLPYGIAGGYQDAGTQNEITDSTFEGAFNDNLSPRVNATWNTTSGVLLLGGLGAKVKRNTFRHLTRAVDLSQGGAGASGSHGFRSGRIADNDYEFCTVFLHDPLTKAGSYQIANNTSTPV